MNTMDNRALSDNTTVPLYQRIKEAIAEKIRSGQWSPGEKIPSENQLADALGVSRMTINRPLRELSEAGLLKRVPGLGTFVAEPAHHASLIELKPITEEIALQGKRHRAKILFQDEVAATHTQAQRMGVQSGTHLFHIVITHYQDDTPIQLESRQVNPALAPGFLQVDFTATTPTEYLMGEIHPDELEHIVQAILPDAHTAMRLSISKQEPCLRLQRRTWKDNTVVTAVDLIYPSSRYDLGARYRQPTAKQP